MLLLSACARGTNVALVDKLISPNDQSLNQNSEAEKEASDSSLLTIHWDEAKAMDSNEQLEAEKFAVIATQANYVNSANTYVFKNNVFITLQLEEKADDSSVILNVRADCKNDDKSKNFNIFSDKKAFAEMAKSDKVIHKTAT